MTATPPRCFPEPTPLTFTDRWATVGRGKGLDRITLTAPVLSAARAGDVPGEWCWQKRGTASADRSPMNPPQRTPARLVQPANDVLILADQDAAAGL